ncbi:MAG TPA: hypothetical protein VL981_04375 [Candidatus Methylacidiphilales bacterium]|nr:hypothetical protein [Candidatus Methylacidiphilales bacterium]
MCARRAPPPYSRVDYEVLDFKKVAADTLESVRYRVAHNLPRPEGSGTEPVSYQARIFAFGRACRQKGLSATGLTLMDFAANSADDRGVVETKPLRDVLQQRVGEAVLTEAEAGCADPSTSWADLLKRYENFGRLFPASNQVAYARESAEVLRKMVAEGARHHPKPLEQMSTAEQVAENIYQLQNLHDVEWIGYNQYPDDCYVAGKEIKTPVDRLVDLGFQAVPQLIAALDDQRFTRCLETYFDAEPAKIMRVGEIAQIILEQLSGRAFSPAMAGDGSFVRESSRKQAEKWWAEAQKKGEEQTLIATAALGNQDSCGAARILAKKYPDVALGAIEKAFPATPDPGFRCNYIAIVGELPGAAPVAFLKSKLASENGSSMQLAAADALLTRGDSTVVPVMIGAWRQVQPLLIGHMPDKGVDDSVDDKAGELIGFLATSGNADAINALGQGLQKMPANVRLAAVQVFLPAGFGHYYTDGPSVVTYDGVGQLNKGPAEKVDAAIERLLVSELDDSGRLISIDEEIKGKDPRICDLAAFVLAKRWPDKYKFDWTANAAACDAQIAVIGDRWRAENQPSAQSR